MKRFWLKIWTGLNYVWPYQATMYAGLFGWAIYNLATHGATPVSMVMTDDLYKIWLITHLIAPALSWAGQVMVRRKPTLKRELLGWELQWTGDTAVCIIAAITAYTFWHEGDITNFDEFLGLSFTGLAAVVAMLVLHDGIAVIYQWVCRKPISSRPDVHC